VEFWYIFSRFGILYQEKSVDPVAKDRFFVKKEGLKSRFLSETIQPSPTRRKK
jgi:hypothetical protein